MSEMIERVARTLCANVGDDPDGRFLGLDNKPTLGWRLHEGPARAAIAAMREPPEKMIYAGHLAADPDDNYLPESAPADVWRAMIDEALK